MALTRDEANAALDFLNETCGVKYEKPAGHFKHIRTTNPIESVFATVRNRTRKTKGCLSRKSALCMVFRVMMSVRKKWRRISEPNRLPEVIQGVVFKDGIKQPQAAV